MMIIMRENDSLSVSVTKSLWFVWRWQTTEYHQMLAANGKEKKMQFDKLFSVWPGPMFIVHRVYIVQLAERLRLHSQERHTFREMLANIWRLLWFRIWILLHSKLWNSYMNFWLFNWFSLSAWPPCERRRRKINENVSCVRMNLFIYYSYSYEYSNDKFQLKILRPVANVCLHRTFTIHIVNLVRFLFLSTERVKTRTNAISFSRRFERSLAKTNWLHCVLCLMSLSSFEFSMSACDDEAAAVATTAAVQLFIFKF